MRQSRWAALSVIAMASGMACAQSSVTLYGVIDTGVERLSNVSVTGGHASLTRMPGQSGGISPSRWGLRGSTDLGDGTTANFLLESGISPDKGSNNTNQGGRLFGRSSWVGLSNKAWGALTLGRQYTAYNWSLLDADFIGPAVYGLGSLDAGIPGARSDNTVAYRGTWAGLTVGGTYSLGRDATNCTGETTGDYKACKEYSLLAKYNSPAWGVALAFDEQRGGPGGTGGLTNSSLTDRRTSGNGFVKLASVRLSAGLIRRNNEGVTTTTVTPRSDLLFAQAEWAVTPAVTVTPLLAQLKYKDSIDGSKATLTMLRASYALSKRTTTYVIAGRMSNKGSANQSVSTGTAPLDSQPTTPGAGQSQTGVMIGMSHSF